MPDHVHLLAETGNQLLSAFMQRLQQSYTQYFNQTHRKVGHLFQGRYTSVMGSVIGSGLDISTILRRGAEGGQDSGRFVLDLPHYCYTSIHCKVDRINRCSLNQTYNLDVFERSYRGMLRAPWL